jgi:acetamidase/formamidase
MAKHTLKATPETVHWGYFDAALKPILTIDSGDEITVDTISGGPEHLPPASKGLAHLPEHAGIHANVARPGIGPHIMTGPIAVKGAKPGDVLQIDILEIEPRQEWGYALTHPLSGALPGDFPEPRMHHIAIDLKRKVGKLPFGGEVPLRPFFGNIGVAPPANWGRITSMIPRRHGGNLDNKELVAGTTLYLPVLTDDALLSIGDGHGVQGDGEVCVTAIEMALRGRFKVTLRTDMTLPMPRAETPTHVITMAFDPDLDIAAKNALRQMIDVIAKARGIDREDAYILCSLVADLRITQMVNMHNGSHVMLEKGYLKA